MAQDPNADDAKQAAANDDNSRVVILTGATGEIGGAIANSLLDYDNNVELHLIARNESKVKKLVESLKQSSNNLKNSAKTNCSVEYHIVDLSSKTDINKFSENWGKRKNNKLDVLLNNAAIVPQNFQTSKDTGEELQFAVNIMSYIRMAHGLSKYLCKSTHNNGARIVNVASQYTEQPGFITVNGKKQMNYTTANKYNSNGAYRQSKAADRMLTKKMSQVYSKDKIYTYSCHPGVTTSNLLKGLGMNHGWDSASKSAQTPVYLAMSSNVKKQDSGSFYKNKAKSNCNFSKDQKKVDQLWDFCQTVL